MSDLYVNLFIDDRDGPGTQMWFEPPLGSEDTERQRIWCTQATISRSPLLEMLIKAHTDGLACKKLPISNSCFLAWCSHAHAREHDCNCSLTALVKAGQVSPVLYTALVYTVHQQISNCQGCTAVAYVYWHGAGIDDGALTNGAQYAGSCVLARRELGHNATPARCTPAGTVDGCCAPITSGVFPQSLGLS
jgi:hypothetical protein